MNVYVREMASALAQQGTEALYPEPTRWSPQEVVEPGHRVVYVRRPASLAERGATDIIDELKRPLSTILKPVADAACSLIAERCRARSQTPPRRAVHCYLSHPRPSERCRWRSRARPRSCGGCTDWLCRRSMRFVMRSAQNSSIITECLREEWSSCRPVLSTQFRPR